MQQPYRESGQAAMRSNIGAALGVASVVAKTLGPRGLDRLLVDDDANFVVTNDGASLLACLDIEHPVGILMSELSQAQDDAVGDGTSSVVILAGEILRGLGLSSIEEFTRIPWFRASKLPQNAAIAASSELVSVSQLMSRSTPWTPAMAGATIGTMAALRAVALTCRLQSGPARARSHRRGGGGEVSHPSLRRGDIGIIRAGRGPSGRQSSCRWRWHST